MKSSIDNVHFSASAARQFGKLPPAVKQQIKYKLIYYLSQKDPLKYAQRLVGSNIHFYRFRMGDYRLIFTVKKSIYTIYMAGHRRDIYKNIV